MSCCAVISYGGCVISGVADRIPDRIGALVYVDARSYSENGQSLHDTLPPPMRDAQLQLARNSGEGWKVPPLPGEVFGVNAQDLEWMNRQCTMQPLAIFQQGLRLTGKLVRAKNIMFVLATGWTPSPFPHFYERAKTMGWKTVSVACGHDVRLDLPRDLVRMLLAASAHQQASG